MFGNRTNHWHRMFAVIFEWSLKSKKYIIPFSGTEPITDTGCLLLFLSGQSKQISLSESEPVTDTGCLLLFFSGQYKKKNLIFGTRTNHWHRMLALFFKWSVTNIKDTSSFSEPEPVTDTGCLLLFPSARWQIKKTLSHFRKQKQSLAQDACCYFSVVN